MSDRQFSSGIFNFPILKKQAIEWASRFDTCLVLDNNGYSQYKYSNYEFIVAAGQKHFIQADAGTAFIQLQDFIDQNKSWVFGYFGYDLKNEIEKLQSENDNWIGFPDLYFFVPEYLLLVKDGVVTVQSADNPENILKEIKNIQPKTIRTTAIPGDIKHRMQKSEYLQKVAAIREHIKKGDVYELNFCQEFYCPDIVLDPIMIFNNLNKYARAPMSSFLKLKDKYLMCASPERFLMKSGDKLVSQPIKGTASRSTDEAEDMMMRMQLSQNPKEKAENVMITDLVRNDLTRGSQLGTTEVEELFGIYSFRHVHQMISTVTSTIHRDIHLVEAIRRAFPMGSMTGAPKVIAMELIDQYETTRRGLFSGAVGYFSPSMDFDFNVVIRSMLYNKSSKYLSYQAGSAITYASNPETEYTECLLKAGNFFQVLGK